SACGGVRPGRRVVRREAGGRGTVTCRNDVWGGRTGFGRRTGYLMAMPHRRRPDIPLLSLFRDAPHANRHDREACAPPVGSGRRLCALLLACAVWATPRAEAEVLRASSFSIGTHMRYAQPLITFGLGAAGHVDYSAPGVGRPGVEVSYGRFGLSTSGSFLTDPLDRLWRAGRSPRGDAQDVRTRYHGTHWGVEAHHLTARGFEVAGVVNQQSVAGYRPDVRLRATGAAISRPFDPAAHVYRLSERQLETGGDVDVLLTAGVSHAGLQGEHPLPTAMAATDSRFAHAERIAVSSATVGGGFAITSNLHGLYFDQSLFGGYGPQYRVWGERSDVTWNLAKVNLRVALGVRTRWFDAGVGVE